MPRHPFVDAGQRLVQGGRAELAEDVTEVGLRVSRRSAEGEPADQLLRLRDPGLADLGDHLLPGLLLLLQVGDDLAEATSVATGDAVVGVDEERPDAVVQLAPDAVALVGQEPAGLLRSRHRVVGRGEGHLVEPLRADLPEAVAGPGRAGWAQAQPVAATD